MNSFFSSLKSRLSGGHVLTTVFLVIAVVALSVLLTIGLTKSCTMSSEIAQQKTIIDVLDGKVEDLSKTIDSLGEEVKQLNGNIKEQSEKVKTVDSWEYTPPTDIGTLTYCHQDIDAPIGSNTCGVGPP